MNKNALINGDFQIWQRGVLFKNPGHLEHTVDRWNVDWNGASNGAFQIVREEFALGQTEVPGEPRYYARWEQLELGSGNTFRDFSQQIEGVRTLAGQTVTISCYLRTSRKVDPQGHGVGRPPAVAPKETVHLVTEQFFGGGGSNGIRVNGVEGTGLFRTSDPFVVTGQWQRAVFTTTLHNIVGARIGPVGDDSLNVIISMRNNPANHVDSANHLSSLDIADVQIELGTVATPFERLSVGRQLSDCERYFQKSYDLDVKPGSPSYPGTENCRQNTEHNVMGVRFRKTMRRPPTVKLYNPASGAEGNWQSLAIPIVVSPGDVGTNGFHVDVAAGIPGEPLAGHWTANAEF
ncbi:MAG: hypothetical protein U0441_31070 [Polyangiaceae bacterium]